MRSLDLFSCVGCHAIGFERAGIETKALCEINPWRRSILSKRFPKAELYGAIQFCPNVPADIVIGGPPCQKTSVAAAIHGKRTGESLWPYMRDLGINSGAEWIVVEQPPGNAAWETEVSNDLSEIGKRGKFHCLFRCPAGQRRAKPLLRDVHAVAGTRRPLLLHPGDRQVRAF